MNASQILTGVFNRPARVAVALCLMGAVGLSGCGVTQKITSYKNRVTFGGYYYKARIIRTKSDPLHFVVTVDNVSQSLENAREAGRYEGTKYCLEAYGNSNVAWVAGPDAEVTALRISDNVLTLEGRCAP